MESLPRISYRGMEASDALSALVDHHIEELERHYPDVTECRVVIEQPHHHRTHGNRWQVKVTVVVPGHVFTVTHADERDERHESPQNTVRDAFQAVQRQLRDRLGRLRAH